MHTRMRVAERTAFAGRSPLVLRCSSGGSEVQKRSGDSPISFSRVHCRPGKRELAGGGQFRALLAPIPSLRWLERRRVYTPGMNLKNAAFLAFIGMALLTIVCAVGFIRDVVALLEGAVAAMTVLASLIHLLASLSVAVFLYVFHKTQP